MGFNSVFKGLRPVHLDLEGDPVLCIFVFVSPFENFFAVQFRILTFCVHNPVT